jgi:large subunit ribosomal protein L6
MSRIAKAPVKIPAGVEIKTDGGTLTVKSAKVTLTKAMPAGVAIDVANGVASLSADSVKTNAAMAGTFRALLSNMVNGVVKPYERKLQLVGVGYRAQVQGKKLNLSLGFSHPIEYPVPEGVTVETPSQTDIIVKGADRHMVGQVAADIRSFRPPEPYKGKGVRYSDERVVLKEAKKK